MRRFLDWTAAQPGAGQPTSSRNSIASANTSSAIDNGQHANNGSSNRHRSSSTHAGNQSGSSSSSTAPTSSASSTATQQRSPNPARDLEIQHLTKLLHEIKYYQASSSPLPSSASSQNQREFVEKVHRTLPLFLNVFAGGSVSATTAATSLSGFSFITYESHSSDPGLDSSDRTPASSKSHSPLPPRSPQMERFPDLLPFAFTIARLFVSEVRQRASNKHAEDASLAILQFLNMKVQAPARPPSAKSDPQTDSSAVQEVSASSKTATSCETSQGWNLLLSLNTLALSQSSQIIQLLCDASLPSTLIKCLYLFFDLPAAASRAPGDTEETNQNSETIFTREVTGGPLIRAFTQLLVQMCSHQSAIDELIKKDDLRLLIGIASSQCSRTNRSWRKTAFQALLAISKNMRDNFMYLEQNMCIQIYVENMHRINSLGLVTTEEYIDMIKTLLEFLYNLDVNNRNQPRCISPLIEQFKSSRIVELIEELLIRMDDSIIQDGQCASPTSSDIQDLNSSTASQHPSTSSEQILKVDDLRRFARRLMQSLTVMARINISPELMTTITTLKPLTMSRFEMFEQFRMPKPSAKNCILNYEALRLFKMAWARCRDSHIIEAILDATISLFNDDRYNYFIFESQQLLVYYMTSQNFKLFPYRVKQKLFKFLEFIIIETNYIPCLELGTLGTIIRHKSSSDTDLILGLRTLIACLRFNSKFSDIFREIGLLECIVDLLSQTTQQDKLGLNLEKLEVLYLLLEASQHLLAGPNNLNCTQFNESGAARHVFNCISKPEFFHLLVPVNSSSSDEVSRVSGPPSRIGTPPLTGSLRPYTPHYGGQCPNSWLANSIRNSTQNKISIKQLQKVSFAIIRQLILSSAGDEHLANLLGLLARNLDDLKRLEAPEQLEPASCSDPKSSSRMDLAFLISQEVNLKICILKSLMIILKDSHRCRTLFRKAGGFIYLVSTLVTLENSLSSSEATTDGDGETHGRWRRINPRRIWRLIKNTLMTVVVAMRSEPANLRAFSDDVMMKFTEALRKLGCFNQECTLLPSGEFCTNRPQDRIYAPIFLAPPSHDFSTVVHDNTKPSDACCQLFRFLYDMSLNMGDGAAELELELSNERFQNSISTRATKSMSFDQDNSSRSRESTVFKRRSQLNLAPIRPPSLDLNARHPEPAMLTFPCIVMTILDLIPSCPDQQLMEFISLVVKSLFKHERNQQLLCEAGMISKLLGPSWRIAIIDRAHFLHGQYQFMLEKLVRQAVTADELRTFFRLENPLRCKNLDDIKITESSEETKQKLTDQVSVESVAIPSVRPEKVRCNRIESLMSMMTADKSDLQPPFVEFDMSNEGFCSIFMPSIAPVNAKSLTPNSSSFLNSTLDVHTAEKNGILGGVGSQERSFPPNSGITFSTWVCVENFPSRSSDPNHNIRLLTIYRGSASTGKEYSCFRLQISALDRAMTISTQEVLLFDGDSRQENQYDPDCNVRIWTPELLHEGRWHHIAVTMNRSMVKQSTINVYVDGQLVHSQRICYINPLVGATNSGPLGNSGINNSASSAAAFVNAFVGSLPQFRFQLATRWKQGPFHILEEPVNANFIGVIYALGPQFIGNFQSTMKLNDLAKFKSLPNHPNYEVRSNSSNDAQKQRALKHQQSAAAFGSNQSQSTQLARVSSVNAGPTPAGGQQSSSNQYHLAEDRVLMNIDARATSLMTLSRMRRIYTRFDCRQVSRVLGLALHENATPILLLHNTSVHLNGPSRGIGALTIGYNHVRCFVPCPTQQCLVSIGGCYILLGLVAQSETVESLSLSLKTLVSALKHNVKLQVQMDNINGYQILSVFYWKKKHLLNPHILDLTFSLIIETPRSYAYEREPIVKAIHQVDALRDLICECFDLWLQTDMINQVLEFIYELISSTNSDNNNLPSHSSSTRVRNLKCLRDMDLLPRMLRLLPQYDSHHIDSSNRGANLRSILEGNNELPESNQSGLCFDTKAVYLIKQTVFELLNRTPRQSDILYFGQFVASLLPSKKRERSVQTISLRNILLKSLLQMMTKNRQKEVNHAMQEELVRILGFDWFMLFISGSHLDAETVTVGFLNLMIILSNDDLYANFKNKALSTKGGWLKEPQFPTMDGKFNIQLLGINVGVFFGLSAKKKSIKQDVLEASNYYLLSQYLTNLTRLPRIYLMIFQTMTSRLSRLDASVWDAIESFDKLNLDVLCDCLLGDNHHKRRQTLAGVHFRCYELVVCLINMLRNIMWQYEPLKHGQPSPKEGVNDDRARADHQNYPTDVIQFLMYLYNNNLEFQHFCRRSDDLFDALCDTLMRPDNPEFELNELPSATTRSMTLHPAVKEILELSRLIILDKMTDISENAEIGDIDQLHAFERFLTSLQHCREAQGELVDMLLRQVLLMIDSTARHNSIKTIEGSKNVIQFQLLLINSITVSQIVTDKIWLQELYPENLGRVLQITDHFLCLAEQIFKFNELLPKHNPPHAFIMQRVLNRLLLFALSRPIQHMSDKMLTLDLLKKIHDNRTIIILNHMHCPQSAEFFVCFAFCLLKIIEENSSPPNASQPHSLTSDQPTSLIERQFGQPTMNSRMLGDSNTGGPCSSDLMLMSIARKVWDAIYQSKKAVLSEALDVSLSLPAFTLDTSPDLLQLKPDIIESCERYWSVFVEGEQRPKRRLRPRSSEPAPGTAASAAVNLLSGRLTRVVNAASFVSRVVGATAGSMASNVNLVGEKLSQTRGSRKDSSGRPISSDVAGQSSPGTPTHSSAPGGSHAQSNPSGVVATQSIDQTDLFRCAGLTKARIEEASRVHISIIEDYVESQMSNKNHKLALHKYLCHEWLDTEYETLLRERAIFGPDYGSELDKWSLDLTEGPRRMRKKMFNNTRQFYDNYPYRPEQYNPSNKSLRYRPPMSYDSHQYYLKTVDLDPHLLELSDQPTISIAKPTAIRSTEASHDAPELASATHRLEASASSQISGSVAKESEIATRADIDTDKSLVASTETSTLATIPANQHHSSIESLSSCVTVNRLNAPASSSPRPSEGDCDGDDADSASFVDFSPEIEAETNSARESENMDSLSVLRLLERNERISHMFRCSRVQGLDTYEGLLLFGREHFYLIDGFTLLKTREIKDIDSLPPDAHDPIIPNSTPNILAHSKKTCSKFSFDSIVEVHKRRYLLQPIALEVFSSDGRNTLIVFPRNIRNKVYSRLMTVATQLNSNAHESLAGQKSNVSIEGGSGILSNLIGDTSVTQRWVRGELSNFQYLMNLNTIAGRSYNDLMQYPIFPWILADYTSDFLDFTKPSTFRDLSRPIGAQTGERLEQFKRRYAEWDDTETPPYHYGTFYSSAMIVASFMVRMEPFTQHFLRLQGGHFDLADRMFHSIGDSWMSASKHNMADIKELIPEFFYLPEFLKNENKYDLGIKQNGMKLNNVILPPWAKDDAREFIRLHRCALESDYVSAHLHEWIDLIFGYKQQGQAAVDAVNVFHHLFYEGNVDIYNTDIDPIKKNAVIGFINNFGQVPKQLFKKPHPVRKISPSSLVGQSQASTPLTPILPSLSVASGTSTAQRLITHCPQALKPTNASLRDLRGPVGQIVQIDKNIVAVEQNKLLIPPEFCRYIAWGHADRSLRLGLYDSEKPIFVWEGSDNMAPNEILCCTIPNNRTMITAGTDSLITVWKIERMRSFTPILNLYGHVEPITCLASSQPYSLIVSGSRDRRAIIWDLNRFTFVRQLGGGPDDKLVHHGPISAIAINDSTGDIATCASSWLYLWTVNGELLAQINTLSVVNQQSMCLVPGSYGQLHILSVCFSQFNEWDLDEVIITGNSDGSVAIWSMRYTQVPTSTISNTEDEKVADATEQANSGIESQDEVATPTGIVNAMTSSDDKQSCEVADVASEATEDAAQASSDPITIQGGGRKRTDTMGSEWVRLSASSTSTADTIPMLIATPTSLSSAGELINGSRLQMGSGECISIGDGSVSPPFMVTGTPSDKSARPDTVPRSSTPVSPSGNQMPEHASTDALGATVSTECTDQAEKCDELDGASMSKANLFLIPNDPSLIKFSKSDTSLVDSFVIVGDSSTNRSNADHTASSGASRQTAGDRVRPQSSTDNDRPSTTTPMATRSSQRQHRKLTSQRGFQNNGDSRCKLQPGHQWQHELYLRTMLLRRNGKMPPPAVTSLSISKDQKTLFVGDASGRIGSWTTS